MKLGSILRLAAWALWSAAGLFAQPGVHLKTSLQVDNTSGRRSLAASSGAKRLSNHGWHLLLVFPTPPGMTELADVESRGARVVQMVPDRGVIALVPENATLEDLRLDWVGRLRPEQKVSPLLVDAGLLWTPDTELAQQSILAEFYSDVTRSGMLAIAQSEGVSIVENPNVTAWQAIVQGTAANLARLAEWDEVAYLFPASREMVEGSPVLACGGAVTAAGAVGQLAAQIGDGWDGPGKGTAELGYFFSTYTGRLTAEQVRGEAMNAMTEWAKAVKIRFSPAPRADSMRTISIRFANGEHGDGYPFDGSGKSLGHTFYPAPPNPETIAGDLHLDDDEQWQIGGSGGGGSGIDLFSVVLHELGHALGLGHSDNPAAVMYPYYRRVSVLTSDDITSIQALYAAQNGTPAVTPANPPAPSLQLTVSPAAQSTQASSIALGGTTAGGSGSAQVTWTNDRGGSGSAQGFRPWTIASIQLQIGDNVITVAAVDSAQGRVTQQLHVMRTTTALTTSLSLQIVSPSSNGVYTSSQPTAAISGTAGPAGQITRLFWVNSRGSGGSMAGTSNWTTSPVALDPGVNHITITALNAASESVTATIDIAYTPVLPGTPDTSAPVLTVLSPYASPWTTTASTISISGTASDNAGVTEVNWVANYNLSGKASGTTSWMIANYPLLPGTNTILIRAYDAAGNMSWRSLSVTRQ